MLDSNSTTERMREVVTEYSTYYVCDVHGWDFTNVDDDVCPVCHGERLAEERIIKLLEEVAVDEDGCFSERMPETLIALINGEK